MEETIQTDRQAEASVSVSLPAAQWTSEHLDVYYATPGFLCVPLCELGGGGDKDTIIGKSKGRRKGGGGSEGEETLILAGTGRGFHPTFILWGRNRS